MNFIKKLIFQVLVLNTGKLHANIKTLKIIHNDKINTSAIYALIII